MTISELGRLNAKSRHDTQLAAETIRARSVFILGYSENLVKFVVVNTKSGQGNHKGLPLQSGFHFLATFLATANPEDPYFDCLW